MTVAEIKKYIDTLTKYYTEDFGKYVRERPQNIIVYLQDIKSMLDELEERPKAEWVNNMNGTFTCSKCGAKRPNDNYCGNCGARMNDELEENNK